MQSGLGFCLHSMCSKLMAKMKRIEVAGLVSLRTGWLGDV
jgi:hypothetical protein